MPPGSMIWNPIKESNFFGALMRSLVCSYDRQPDEITWQN